MVSGWHIKAIMIVCKCFFSDMLKFDDTRAYTKLYRKKSVQTISPLHPLVTGDNRMSFGRCAGTTLQLDSWRSREGHQFDVPLEASRPLQRFGWCKETSNIYSLRLACTYNYLHRYMWRHYLDSKLLLGSGVDLMSPLLETLSRKCAVE